VAPVGTELKVIKLAEQSVLYYDKLLCKYMILVTVSSVYMLAKGVSRLG
jgi:hypothetical protein